MSDEQFTEFMQRCRDQLSAKQGRFAASLPHEGQWRYDLDAQCLFIGDHDYRITVIGSHHPQRQTWLWAWANDAFPEGARKSSAAIKSLHDLTGFNVFIDHGIGASTVDAQDLSAMAIHVLEASGLYRCPGDDVTIYLAVHFD